jgi:ferric-dicitrate binding protein FerR (iron transport regulator)
VDELILQVLREEAPPDVVRRVRSWRAESEANEAYYRDTARIWSLTEPEPVAVPAPPTVATVVAAAEARRTDEGRPAVVPLRPRRPRPLFGRSALGWSAALAAALAAVAIGLRTDFFTPGPGPTTEYVALDAPRVLTLDDGSFVKLAPGSTLRIGEWSRDRRVALQGRAFFAVARDSEWPFVVEAGVAETRVLGTRFEVAVLDEGVRAVVVEGVVAVSNRDGTVEVPAGSVARATEGAAPAVESVADVHALLDWPGGVMLFQATPLVQAAREVARRFGRRVDVIGADLRAVRISGTLEEERFEDAVLSLCQTAGAECALTDAGARIER